MPRRRFPPQKQRSLACGPQVFRIPILSSFHRRIHHGWHWWNHQHGFKGTLSTTSEIHHRTLKILRFRSRTGIFMCIRACANRAPRDRELNETNQWDDGITICISQETRRIRLADGHIENLVWWYMLVCHFMDSICHVELHHSTWSCGSCWSCSNVFRPKKARDSSQIVLMPGLTFRFHHLGKIGRSRWSGGRMWVKLLELWGFHNQENKDLMLTSTGGVQLFF